METQGIVVDQECPEIEGFHPRLCRKRDTKRRWWSVRVRERGTFIVIVKTATHSSLEQQFTKTCTVCGSETASDSEKQIVVEGRYGLTEVPFSIISFTKPVDITACS